MPNLKDPSELQLEFDNRANDFQQYHADMQFSLDAYTNNVFYPQEPNSPKRKSVGVNLLQVFGDKLWFYHAGFPKISVPSVPEDRDGANKREKIINATHYHNQSPVRWSRQAFDGMSMSVVITVTEFDFTENCVKLHRVDPRRAFWQRSDGVADEIEVFWAVEPMTKAAIKRKFKVDVTGSPMSLMQLRDFDITPADGVDYFTVITRIDRQTVTKWVGKQLLVTPYNHLVGTMPVDLAFPLETANYLKQGDFYLRRLYNLQAEFNEYWRQRANIVRKLGNPLVWGRGIKQKQFETSKEAMQMDGGFVGLTETGELGLLTIPETKMIDNALNDTFARMRDTAGFPTAAFGEIAGANTSGDALGMYFQPTTRMIAAMNIAYKAHHESVNSKILRLYDTFLPADMTKELNGYVPQGRYVPAADGAMQYQKAFSVEFNKYEIAGNYNNEVIMDPAAPKDEAAYKTLLISAMQAGLFSKTTFYNEWGLLSPEDELAMLKEENGDPLLNPAGTSKILQAQQIGAGNGVPTNGQ